MESDSINQNFVDDNGKFDEKKFNKAFDEFKLNRRLDAREKEKSKLAQLAKAPEEKPFYKYSIGETLIAIKDNWFEILDDLLQYKIESKTFTKDLRPYFIGLTLIIVGVIIMLYQFLFNPEVEHKNIPKLNFVLKID
jgi:hypothetical protein